MNTVYHLSSAKELDDKFIEAIKAAYHSKPITIIIQESESDFDLSDEMKLLLDDRLQEEEENFITVEESVSRIRKLNEL